MARTSMKDLMATLERIEAELRSLAERVEKLESAAPKEVRTEQATAARSRPEPAPAAPKQQITEEELIAISAALAAYLGVRVRIKQIRLLSSHAWAQQGRVSIQASHNLHN